MSNPEALKPGWRRVKFGDVVRDAKNTTKDPEADGLERVVGLDHLDPESLPLRRWDELADLHEGTSFTRTFKAGQVLFGKRRAYQRKVAVPDFEGICSSDILVFEPSTPELLPDFLPYLVQSDGFFDHALGTSAGSLSPRTKWQELAKYEFALPPLEEQARLVEMMNCCDAQITSSESVIWESNRLARVIFESEVSSLDVVPVRLKSIARCVRGYSFKGSDYADDPLNGHPFLTLAAVSKSGGLKQDGLKYLKSPTAERHSVEQGDLLLANTDLTPGREFIGRPLRVPAGLPPLGFSHHLSALRFDRAEDRAELSPWLFYELQSRSSRGFVRSIARGSTVIMLDAKQVAEWPIRLPERACRDRILRIISNCEATGEAAEQSLVEARSVRRAMLAACFGGTSV